MKTISYTAAKSIKIKGDILARLSAFFEKKNQFSTIKKKNVGEGISTIFFIKDEIISEAVRLSIQFTLNDEKVTETIITLLDENERINEYHLKHYLSDIFGQILLSEHNDELIKYVVRTYLRIFNSHQLEGEYEINCGRRINIKPVPIKNRDEPLTEHIIMFDTEVSAVNIDQARSVAYNNTRDVTALLAVLLDVGFEFITSEFRIFMARTEQGLGVFRYRTGYVDTELGLIVKDNMNGLEHPQDRDELSGRFSGKVSFRMLEEDGGKMGDEVIFHATSNRFLSKAFETHTIKKGNITFPPYREKIQKSFHFMNCEIKMPRCVRQYFKKYFTLRAVDKEAFLSCARMYNIALTAGRNEPTLAAAYIICAVEALALGAGLKFSEFLRDFADAGFDKKLTDYFYSSVRSAHFHAGKLLFNESSINLQIEFDAIFMEKQQDYISFYNIARGSIVNWINRELLGGQS